MDCLTQQEGSTLLAFGSEKGKIYLRQDWEESGKNYCCKNSKILDLKFSSNGKYLIAAAKENLNNEEETIFIFQKNGDHFFDNKPTM